MFRQPWQYASISRDLEELLQSALQCPVHSARAHACHIRRAAMGTARNHWPSPFAIPGMAELGRAFLRSIAAGEKFVLSFLGTASGQPLPARILKHAHENIDVRIDSSQDTGAFTICFADIRITTPDLSPALLALQTGIALKLATHPWFDKTLAVIDFETTGFSATESRITEYGLVLVQNEITLETGGTLINPGIPIPPEITTITGIDDTMVSGAPRESAVIDDLLSSLARADLVGGHNFTDFDSKFLEAFCARCGKRPPALPHFDTLHLARRYLEGQPNNKQPTLLAWLGWQGEVFHRAVDDTRGCAFLLRAALRSAAGVHAYIEEVLPLVFLAEGHLAPGTENTGTARHTQITGGLFSGPVQTRSGLETVPPKKIFCTRLAYEDQSVPDSINAMGQLVHDPVPDSIVILLENLPGNAARRTALPEDGLAIDLLGLTWIITAPPTIWDDARIRPDARYDCIIRIEGAPVEGTATATLLDLRLNPLALRS